MGKWSGSGKRWDRGDYGYQNLLYKIVKELIKQRNKQTVKSKIR